jgi:hypothetical protein
MHVDCITGRPNSLARKAFPDPDTTQMQSTCINETGSPPPRNSPAAAPYLTIEMTV